MTARRKVVRKTKDHARKGRPAVAGEPRNVRLEVRVTADERARIEAAAGHGHASEWVRRVVLAALRAEMGR